MDGTFNSHTCGRIRNRKKNIKRGEDYRTVNGIWKFVAYRPRALVNCGDSLWFAATSLNRQKFKVKFTGIVFFNTSMTFIDTSVEFDNCTFSRSIHPLNLWLSPGANVTLVVKNSSFFNNLGGIHLRQLQLDTFAKYESLGFAKHHENPPPRMDNRGRYLPFPVGIDIFCSDTIFSKNTGPLFENTINSSRTNELYHRITLVKNSAPSNGLYISKAKFHKALFDGLVCTDNIDTHCIYINSKEVSLGISRSNISGNTANDDQDADLRGHSHSLVSPWASVFIIAVSGQVNVFETEWKNHASCFYLKCTCNVNFTKVNTTGSTSKNAVIILSGDEAMNDDFGSTEMKIHLERCIFRLNEKNHIKVVSKLPFLHLVLNDVKINGEQMEKSGTNSVLDVQIEKTALGSSIRLHDFEVTNAVGSTSVVFRIYSNNSNNVEIVNSVFRKIRSVFTNGYLSSPLSIFMPKDMLIQGKGCNNSYLRFSYINTITILNTTFKDNIGRSTGGVLLYSGNVTIRGCYFENNYAIKSGGHVRVEDQHAMLKIENSILKQTSAETIFNGETFTHHASVYSESPGSLQLRKTLIVAELDKDSYRLLSVVRAGLVEFDNFSKIQCAIGSVLRVDNFSHFMFVPSSSENPECWLKITVMTISCHQCLAGFYSLQRGEIQGLPKKEMLASSDLFCSPCPYGANCSRNIEAKPNFWGYPELDGPNSLKFVHCPAQYCRPGGKEDKTDLSVYNSCRGNRDGVMCGRCKIGYTETLFSKKCKRIDKCKDHWIWPLTIIYGVVMALLFIHKPPIIRFLVKNILWFANSSRNRTEYTSLEEPDHYNKGYKKIIFHFYQISSYLNVEPISDAIKNTADIVKETAPLVTFFSGIFNFIPTVSSEGFGCPFPGLNVVTKELILSSGVFATLISVQAILILHFTWNKLRGRPDPPLAPYVAATLETLLLGCATLANTALKLLTCVPVLGESRLYYDGNIKCWQWWHCFFLFYVVIFLLPFIAVIYWGAMKLQRGLISVGHFIGACFFPLGFISLWIIQKLFYPRNQRQCQEASLSETRVEALKVLHDSFRPPSRRKGGSLHWESVLIGRRFLLLSYQVFFPDPLIRLFFMDITCLFVFAWHLTVKPFRDRKANVIEAISLAFLVVIATINLIQANFLSAGVNPQGPVKRHVIMLQQVEICLLAIVPLLLGFLCMFAVVSQLARILVLLIGIVRFVFRRVITLIIIRRVTSRRYRY